MKIDTKKLAEDITRNFRLIDQTDIPNISLYMDQVTTFMEEHLSYSRRHADDKILTKTMINNYAKNDLLPPPDKKRYSKEHVIVLTFIYYFKSILSITDIKTILTEVTDKYFAKSGNVDIEKIYDEISNLQEKDMSCVKEDIDRKIALSSEAFADAPKNDREFLQLFSLICMLSFDVYIKKQMLESIVDELSKKTVPGKKKK